jgi:excisionase family DNA binding protein
LTYSVEEAAKLLGISRAFAYECVNRGLIPHIRMGRRLLIPRSALHMLVASAEEAGVDPREGKASG